MKFHGIDCCNACVRGQDFLFTESRVPRDIFGKDSYIYEIRHSDDNDSVPVEIADRVVVNFFGTLIGTEPIENWDVEDDNGRSILLKMSDIPEYYYDSDDCLTDDAEDEDGIPNEPVYYPLDDEFSIDWE